MTNLTIATYYCAACDTGLDEHMIHDDDEGTACPHCGEPNPEHTGHRPAEWACIAAYTTCRVYGGPEEGGWYYTQGYPIPGTRRDYQAGDFPAMQQYRELLETRYEGDRDVMIRTTVERSAKPFPSTRPHYC